MAAVKSKTAKAVSKESSEIVKEEKAKKTVKKPRKTTVKKTAVKKAEVSMENKEILKDDKKAYITIDFPVESEIIKGHHYAIRIGASKNGYVELSFNEGEWHPCRFAAGYWWFDWLYFTPGKYTLSARLVDQSGKVLLKTDGRKYTVC